MTLSSSPYVSLVIPAYNEALRLPPFLNEVLSFTRISSVTYEIIIVDDGSTDQTAKIAGSYLGADGVRFIRLKANRGKGYAVKRGFFAAKGRIRAFMDADGSYHPGEVEKNLIFFEQECDVVIGSRFKKGSVRKTRIVWWRAWASRAFNLVVRWVLGIPFQDTQCGFKIIRAELAKPIFGKMRVRRFGFDMEFLYLVHRMGYKVVEVPVTWEHKEGSKVNMFLDPFDMMANIFQIRKRYENDFTLKKKKVSVWPGLF